MALRGDPSIPELTRRKISAAAEALGYRRSPLVAALMSLQRRRRPLASTTLTVAWIASHQPACAWRQVRSFRAMFTGAETQAAAMGFKLEEFNLGPDGLPPERLLQVLWTRRIQAALIAPLPQRQRELPFDISSLATIGVGASVRSPVIARVASDHFESAFRAVRECHALGYRRIGLILSEETSERLEHRWLGGFLTARERLDLRPAIPPLMTPETAALAAAMPPWLERHRPEVVIFGSDERELYSLVPPEVGLVSLSVDEADGELTGIDQNFPKLGKVAMEHLIARLYSSQLGALEEEQIHLVAGRWVPGRTARGPGVRR